MPAAATRGERATDSEGCEVIIPAPIAHYSGCICPECNPSGEVVESWVRMPGGFVDYFIQVVDCNGRLAKYGFNYPVPA